MVDMRTKSITLIAIALIAAACATVSAPLTAGAVDAPLEPLQLGISIHVEGYRDDDPAIYAQHQAIVATVADEAETAGAVLTFELNTTFVEGATTAADGWVAGLDDQGQSVGVHADLGGTPITAEAFETGLQEQRAAVEALLDPGDVVTSVSGICSEQDWVTPAITAGFDVATGGVEFCLKSLTDLPATYDAAYIDACDNPQDCHGQAPTDLEHKLHPWRTSDSSTWLTDDPAGDLWILAGESGTPIHCLAEGGSGRCRATNADIPLFADLVQTYVDAREAGRFNSLNLSWSIGSPPRAGFMTALAASIQPLVDAGDVEWSSLGDIAVAAQAAADAAGTEETTTTTVPEETTTTTTTSTTSTTVVVEETEGEHWVTNPDTGNDQYVRAFVPDGTGTFPVIVLVPGGVSWSQLFIDHHDAENLEALGYLTVIYDPEGRGSSEGTEDSGGLIHQAGLAEIVRWASARPEADSTRVAIVSNSFGVTHAAGALVNHPDLDVDVLVDWEGPADRDDTGGCDGTSGGHLAGNDCEDETFWSEREAVTFVGQITEHYVRLQSRTDHVQADNDHALAMVNAAVNGPAASVHLNRTEVTSPLTYFARGVLLPDAADRQFPTLVDDALSLFF